MLLLSFLVLFVTCNFDPSAYPHWNTTKYEGFLSKFDVMVRNHGFLDNSACIDFDGTIATQAYGYMEVLLLQYAINLMDEYSWIHPNYQLSEYERTKFYFSQIVNFMLDKDTEKPTGLSRLWHIAQMYTSMTIEEHKKEIDLWIQDSSIHLSKFFFLPILDLFQRLSDYGFYIFIISESNTIFVSHLFYHVQNELEYLHGVHYDFKNLLFIGNELVVNEEDNRYSSYVNNKYVQNAGNETYFVDGEGKMIAIQRYIEGTLGKKKPIFSLGNSDGDYFMIKYIGNSNPTSLSAVVNPIGENLGKLVKDLDLDVLVMNTGV